MRTAGVEQRIQQQRRKREAVRMHAVQRDRVLIARVVVHFRQRLGAMLARQCIDPFENVVDVRLDQKARSEEHTSELQSLMRISYAVFCLTNTNKLGKSPCT